MRRQLAAIVYPSSEAIYARKSESGFEVFPFFFFFDVLFFLSSSREGFVLRCAHAWGGIMIVSSGPLRLSADCFRADGRLEKVLFSARLGRLIAWFGARFRLLDV